MNDSKTTIMTNKDKLKKVKQYLEALKKLNDEDDKRKRPSNKERFHIKYESPFMYYLWMAQNKQQ